MLLFGGKTCKSRQVFPDFSLPELPKNSPGCQWARVMAPARLAHLCVVYGWVRALSKNWSSKGNSGCRMWEITLLLPRTDPLEKQAQLSHSVPHSCHHCLPLCSTSVQSARSKLNFNCYLFQYFFLNSCISPQRKTDFSEICCFSWKRNVAVFGKNFYSEIILQ